MNQNGKQHNEQDNVSIYKIRGRDNPPGARALLARAYYVPWPRTT